jgi:hypothetical protein
MAGSCAEPGRSVTGKITGTREATRPPRPVTRLLVWVDQDPNQTVIWSQLYFSQCVWLGWLGWLPRTADPA